MIANLSKPFIYQISNIFFSCTAEQKLSRIQAEQARATEEDNCNCRFNYRMSEIAVVLQCLFLSSERELHVSSQFVLSTRGVSLCSLVYLVLFSLFSWYVNRTNVNTFHFLDYFWGWNSWGLNLWISSLLWLILHFSCVHICCQYRTQALY